jgi:general secretion pathway protein A
VYQRFFGFTAKPFALNPDPAFLYPSRQHAEALTMLEYGIESQANFFLLTGEIGSGKTTVIRQFIRILGARFAVGLISNTHSRFSSILPWALSALNIVPSDGSDIAQYEAFTDAVVHSYGKGKRTLLILDEAQNLSVEVLEELRLLSNVNSEQDVALQVLLVGQPELRVKLERDELTQFAQRVSVDFHLESLTLNETREYIRHRLSVAGGNAALFEPEAEAFIHARAGGIPRLMNQLCDLALVYAYAEQRRSIDLQLVRLALQERNRGRAIRIFSGDQSVLTLTPKNSALDVNPASNRI